MDRRISRMADEKDEKEPQPISMPDVVYVSNGLIGPWDFGPDQAYIKHAGINRKGQRK
jgi:hypothetical protein